MHPVQLLISAILFMLMLDEFFTMMAYLMFGADEP